MFAVNQSLTKKLIINDVRIPICPSNIFHIYILKDVKDADSIYMLYGRYFETLLIGSGAHDQKVFDLPRKRPTKKQLLRDPNAIGEKRIAQIRIESQAEKGKKIIKEKNISVIKNFNTQVVIYKRWEKNYIFNTLQHLYALITLFSIF